MFDYWFEQIGGIKVIMNCKYNTKNASFLENKMPHFYYNLIMTFFLYRSCTFDSYRREMIWLNRNVRYKRKMLFFFIGIG